MEIIKEIYQFLNTLSKEGDDASNKDVNQSC